MNGYGVPKRIALKISHAEELAITNSNNGSLSGCTNQWKVVIINGSKKKSTKTVDSNNGCPRWDACFELKHLSKELPVTLLVTDSKNHHVGQLYLNEQELEPYPYEAVQQYRNNSSSNNNNVAPPNDLHPCWSAWSRKCGDLEPTKRNSFPRGRLYYWAWVMEYRACSQFNSSAETASHSTSRSSKFSASIHSLSCISMDEGMVEGGRRAARISDTNRPRGLKALFRGRRSSKKDLQMEPMPSLDPVASTVRVFEEANRFREAQQQQQTSENGSRRERRHTYDDIPVDALRMIGGDGMTNGHRTHSPSHSSTGSLNANQPSSSQRPTPAETRSAVEGLPPVHSTARRRGGPWARFAGRCRSASMAALHRLGLSTEDLSKADTPPHSGSVIGGSVASHSHRDAVPRTYIEDVFRANETEKVTLEPSSGHMAGGYTVTMRSNWTLANDVDDVICGYVNEQEVARSQLYFLDPCQVQLVMPGVSVPCRCFVELETHSRGRVHCEQLFMYLDTPVGEEDAVLSELRRIPPSVSAHGGPVAPPRSRASNAHFSGLDNGPTTSGSHTHYRRSSEASGIVTGLPPLPSSALNSNRTSTTAAFSVNTPGGTFKSQQQLRENSPMGRGSGTELLVKENKELHLENDCLRNRICELERALREKEEGLKTVSESLCRLRTRLLADNLIEYLEKVDT